MTKKAKAAEACDNAIDEAHRVRDKAYDKALADFREAYRVRTKAKAKADADFRKTRRVRDKACNKAAETCDNAIDKANTEYQKSK